MLSSCKEVNEEEGRRFAERMKRFRKKHALSQTELGAAMGVARFTIMAMETCRYRPYEGTVLRFAQLEAKYERVQEKETEELEGLA
jgi:DNA-binding XRE family transcriptional regulator